MKKAFVLLALSLAALSSLADSRNVHYRGYRIGDSGIFTDQTRIAGLPFAASNVGQQGSKELTASQIPGQKIVRWWAYQSESNSEPYYQNEVKVADGDYSLLWTYDTVKYDPVNVVVDYEYIKYNLSYNANGGSYEPSTDNNIIYTNGVSIASSNGVTRVGYTWSGWTNDLTPGVVWMGGETVTGASLGVTATYDDFNVVLRAKWTPKTYTVTLNANGGSVSPESKSVTYDATYGDLPVPTRPGYAFDGWYTIGESKVTAGTKVLITAAQTLYAHWTANNYTVSFNANGGTGSMANQSFVYDEAKNLTSNSFVKTGYSFGGWATAPASTCEYGDGELVKNLTATANGTVTLYAVWTPITYTISFDGNGADSGSVGNIAATYDVEYPLPDNGFERTGRSFKAWRLGSDGDTYNVGDSVSNLTTTAGDTVTFYAFWTEPRYIAFHGNGADNSDAMADDMMMFDGIETKPLVPNEFEKTGYTFVGWATNETDAAALKCAYTNCEDVISTNLWMDVCETNDFYAVWQTNKYTVIFNANGGWGSMANQEFVYDQAQYLPSRDTKITSNLDFQGWATNSTGDVVFREVVDPVSNLTVVADGVIMLYAVWDNSELSKAMHCDNLSWEQSDPTEITVKWNACIGAEEGYNPSDSSPSGSSVCAIVPDDKDASCVMKPLGVSGAGKLSFWYKMSSQDASLYWLSCKTNSSSSVTIEPKTTWTRFGPIDIEYIEYVDLTFVLNNSSSAGTEYKVWIDQMKWEPEGEDKKPSVYTNDVPTAVTGLVYDGKEKTGVIAGYGYTVGYTISGNVATNAGNYVATATPDAYCVWPDGSSDAMKINWSIAKATYDMSGVTFDGATFVVDGDPKYIEISGTLPDGVNVSYSGNGETEPGVYTVTASFTGDTDNYELIQDMTATMTIEKRRVAIPSAMLDLVYDGLAKTGVVASVGYTLSDNVATNAGNYEATATLADWYVWDDGTPDEQKIQWSIAKATYDMSGVTFTNATFVADGEAHSIYVSGDLPEGVEVLSYSGNDKIEPGTYTVTASFTGDADNYEPIADMTATMTITRGSGPNPDAADLVLHPDGEPSLDAFTAEKAATYVGWLRDGSGRIAAQLTVKTSAAKSGKAAKSTITVTPVGGKKYTLKTTVQPGGNPTDEFGITYGALGLTGTVEGFSVEASADVAKSKDATVKALAGKIPVGTYTFIVETDDGTAVFSAIIAKNGKTKVQGFLGNGTKVSVSATGSLGDTYFAVPVVVSKSKVSFGFVLWIPLAGGSPVFVGAIGTSWQALRTGGAYALADGVHVFDFVELPTFRSYIAAVDGTPVAPVGEKFTVSGSKWAFSKTSGKLKVVDGFLSIVANGEPSNLSGLKLTYTAKTGLVKGSFKLYYMEGGKVKFDKVTITGAVVDGVFMGSGTVKKLGSFAVWAE